MNSYRNIPIWENVRRVEVLEKFRDDVVSYFSNSNAMELGEGRRENTDAVQARQRINLTVDQARRIIEAVGIPQIIRWTPPPIVGGDVQHLDVLPSLFELDSFQIPHERAVDLIDRALGVYQFDHKAALRRTINPFWWLKRSILWLLSIPFVLLGAVGFDAGRAEGSFFGKMFKLLVATSAVLTILNYMGWLPAARALLGIE